MPTKEIVIEDVKNWEKPKKHICCVVDTECTFMSEQSRLVYEFAWVISDLNDIENKNYFHKNFYIQETVRNPEAFLQFTKKYTDNGIPKINFGIDSRYGKLVKNCFNNFSKVEKWENVIKQFNADCLNLGVDTITAYNFMFDSHFFYGFSLSPS